MESSEKYAVSASDLKRTSIEGLLDRWRHGDQVALEALNQLVFKELRKLAGSAMRAERRDHTLQPTALVNEAFLELSRGRSIRPESKTHFFGIAAHLMRQILIQHAREKAALKRGGAAVQVELDDAMAVERGMSVDALDLHQALEELTELDPRQARIVELRYFAGMKVGEVASELGLSPATVKREWTTAKAWLFRRLRHDREE